MGYVVAMLSMVTIPMAIFMALRLTAGRFVLSPANIYLILYLLFHFPLILLADMPTQIFGFVANLGLIGFVVGMYLAMHGTNPTVLRARQTTTPIALSPGYQALALILFGLLITVLFYKGLPPSFNILGKAIQGRNVFGDLLAMSGFRADLTKSHYFGGSYSGQGALKLFNEMAWQLIVVFMYVRALQINTRKAWYQMAAVGFLAFLIVYGVGAKGPVAYIVIAALTARSFMVNIPFNRLAKYTLFLLTFLIIIQSMQVSRFVGASNEDGFLFFTIIETLARRVAAGNGLNTLYIVNLIEEGRLTYYNGYDHLTKFLNALPGIQFDTPFAHDLFWLIAPEKASHKTTYATYTYLGGSFLDFGFIGAFLTSAVAGFVLQSIYRFMLWVKPTTFSIAMSATFAIHLGQIVAGSLVSLPATIFVVGTLCSVIFISKSIMTAFVARPIGPPLRAQRI